MESVCLSLCHARTELAPAVGRAGGEDDEGRDGGEVDDAALFFFCFWQ